MNTIPWTGLHAGDSADRRRPRSSPRSIHTRWHRVRCAGLGLSVAVLALTARGQNETTTATDAAGASSSAPVTVAPVQSYGTQVVSPLAPAVAATPAGAPLQWGSVAVRPHLAYRMLYGDGIQSNPGEPVTTAIQTIAPGVLFGWATHWTLDYTPTWTLYSNRAFRNTLDHAADLAGGAAYGDWNFHLSQGYVSESPPLVETGAQTKQELWSTALQAIYHYGDRFVFDATVSQNVRFAEGFTDTREWSTLDWLHNRVSQRLDTAVGIGWGYVDVSPGPNMTYVRPQAQIAWRSTDKISFSLRGGYENRKLNSHNAADLNNPTYGASIQYQPIETTALTLGAARDVTTSYFAGQVTKSTGWNASLQQRLLQVLNLTVSFARQTSTYVATTDTVAASRDDRTDSLDVRLGTTVLRRGTVAILYQYRHNSSTDAGFRFSSRQIGIDFGYRF